MSCSEGGLLYDHVWSSWRVHCTRTGLPIICEISAASVAASSALIDVRPNQLAPSLWNTVTLFACTPSCCAIRLRTSCGPDPADQTLAVPSAATSATAV